MVDDAQRAAGDLAGGNPEREGQQQEDGEAEVALSDTCAGSG
jgi:hypothetical protein